MRFSSILLCMSALACLAPRAVADGGPGLVEQQIFAPFDEQAPPCSKPPNLARELVFAQDNRRQFMQGVARGLKLAAEHRGLGYRVMLADNDPQKMIGQVEAAHGDRVGALVAAPVEPASLAPSLQKLIWAGAYVGTIVPPPATSLLNAPQYLSGKVLATAAIDYIKSKLGGTARVVLLTHDNLEFLAARFVAMRDVLAELPGVTVVADISPLTVDIEGGHQTMRTILLAHPDIDVILGADTVVLGALKALREAGRERPDQFLGGIDGEPEAVAEIKRGGPYKVSVSLASPVFAYAMGQHAADWLDGKSIPQAMDILPIALDRDNIGQYEDDTAHPDQVYADPVRRARYLEMYGNICYDTRADYVNFPWSSEPNVRPSPEP